ncbi:MAG: hypothetical protein WBD78_08920 [Methylocella sp.]
MNERDDALRQTADLLVGRLYRFVGARAGHPLESITWQMAEMIERRLITVVETLIGPRPIDEKGKKALAANVYGLLTSVNTASHGIIRLLDFLEKSKIAAMRIERMKSPRASKAALVASRHLKLDQAIEDEVRAQKRRIAISLTFAGEIRPGVRARLSLEPTAKGWPENGTIVRRISAIRKKRCNKK